MAGPATGVVTRPVYDDDTLATKSSVLPSYTALSVGPFTSAPWAAGQPSYQASHTSTVVLLVLVVFVVVLVLVLLLLLLLLLLILVLVLVVVVVLQLSPWPRRQQNAWCTSRAKGEGGLAIPLKPGGILPRSDSAGAAKQACAAQERTKNGRMPARGVAGPSALEIPAGCRARAAARRWGPR